MAGFLENTQAISRVCDRRFGVGCDQLIVLEASKNAEVSMLIRNADGSRAGMCGNAARCVAGMLLEETGKSQITLDVYGRLLDCCRAENGEVTIDMGKPVSVGRADLGLDTGTSLPVGITVDVGNPHVVFFVDDAEAVDLARLGPLVERHPLFPEKTNVEFVSTQEGDCLRMRVWERGAGVTLACGSGACSTAYAAFVQGLAPRKTRIRMDGGTLSMTVREGDDHILMTGPFAKVFDGVLTL